MVITGVQTAPPAPAAESKPLTLAALEAAAKNADAAGDQALSIAKATDAQNGKPEDSPGLPAADYEVAGGFDDRAGQQYEKAANDWKEVADKYKAAGEVVKSFFNDADVARFTTKITELQKSADHSKQMAIESYNKAAVEYVKSAKVATQPTNRLKQMESATKSLDSGAHVGQESDKKDKKDK